MHCSSTVLGPSSVPGASYRIFQNYGRSQMKLLENFQTGRSNYEYLNQDPTVFSIGALKMYNYLVGQLRPFIDVNG
jgi:hypothetical protein